MDTQGVHYSTSLPAFEQTLIGLFDKGIGSTQNVPQLEKVGVAFENLYFFIDMYINTFELCDQCW